MSTPTLPKAYCTFCGQPVRIVRDSTGEWVHGRCQWHEFSKRMPQGFIERAFASLRAAVEAAPDWRKEHRV
jgi:hypothetical protein